MDSVRNALRALVLLGERGSMRLIDVALELDLARSTTHRLLVTMREAGFVIQPIGERVYTLGPIFAGLASPTVAHDDLIAAARPTLTSLRRATEETANLLTRLGADVYYLDGAESARTVRVGLKNGARLPVVVSAAGLAMLAELSPERVDRVIFLTRRQRSIDEHWLQEQLELIRVSGYAVSHGLALEDMHEVGVAFHYPPGDHVAALTIAAPSHRLDDARAREVAMILRHSANSLSNQLGRRIS